MPIRISKSHRERDPNGHITSFALRVGTEVTTYPADGPEWRHVAAWVVQTLYEAGLPIPPVKAGDDGRLLLGSRADFIKERIKSRPVEETPFYTNAATANAHAYLSIIFGVLPTDYTDEDFWVEYEPVFRRPRQYNRRGRADADDPDEESLFLWDT